MFMMSMGVGQVLGFPDVCLTPMPAPTPMPYPNLALSALTPGAVKNVLCSCTPTVNMTAAITMSNGNQAGVALGAVSHTIMGGANWILGSVKTFVGGTPAQRLCSVTTCNCMGVMPNGPGAALVPSQPRVLVLT
ncbi:MAG: DUF4150 domain-containing protein [Candidatus Adiutrix sp.]|jgi:hypothetical protein|nr:DUF4150 domain-containing protein [Candidatus Adiutrix sp.]